MNSAYITTHLGLLKCEIVIIKDGSIISTQRCKIGDVYNNIKPFDVTDVTFVGNIAINEKHAAALSRKDENLRVRCVTRKELFK